MYHSSITIAATKTLESCYLNALESANHLHDEAGTNEEQKLVR